MADDLRVLDYLFASRLHESLHLSTRQYAPIVNSWVEEIGLDSANYGTHSMRRTKASLIYRRTKNLREVELLLGHTKLESTVKLRRNVRSHACPSFDLQNQRDKFALAMRVGLGKDRFQLIARRLP